MITIIEVCFSSKAISFINELGNSLKTVSEKQHETALSFHQLNLFITLKHYDHSNAII